MATFEQVVEALGLAGLIVIAVGVILFVIIISGVAAKVISWLFG